MKSEEKSIHIGGEVKIAKYDWYDKYEERIIIFNNKGEQVVLCFDTSQTCCEVLNLDYDYEIENGRTISTNGVMISWSVDRNFEPGDDEGGKIDITVSGNIDSFNISFSNDHNGYYAHQILITGNGEIKYEEWL